MAENEQSYDSARPPDDARVALRTSELGAEEGRHEWQHTLGSLYAEMDVAWPAQRRELDAEWGGRQFGDLHVSTIRCDEQTVVRSAAMIESDSCADYLVCVITEGHVEVHQSGRRAVLQRGAFALLDLGAPFVFHSPATFRQVVVRIPGQLMAPRLPDGVTYQSTGRSFDDQAGSAALTARFLADLATTRVATAAVPAFASSAIAMLSATILDEVAEDTPGQSFRAQDLARINRVIDQRLHDCDLTLSEVASRSGMSLRNVQKLVRTTGNTPSGLLHDARIGRAKQLLLTTNQTIAAISGEVGFRDVSHFGRLFRAKVGISPGRFRAGHPVDRTAPESISPQ